MELEGQVGYRKMADGAKTEIRLENSGAAVVQQLHGDLYETTARGNMKVATIANVTLAAVNAATITANASPTFAAGGTGIITILNPNNSKKNIAINEILISTVSGTPAGGFFLFAIPNVTSITASLTAKPLNANTLAFDGAAQIGYNVALTGSLLGQCVAVLGGPSTTAVGAGIYSVQLDKKSTIVMQPNSAIVLACRGAGTTHIIDAQITFEEIDFI